MLAKHHIPFQLKLDGSSKSTLQVMLKGDKLLLFWIFTLFLVFFQVSLASKSEKSLTETAKDGSKYKLKVATGGGKIAKKHKHKKKGKHKHKSKKSKNKSKIPKISDGFLDSFEEEKSPKKKEKSTEKKEKSKEKEKSTEKEKSSESSEPSESCGSCTWGEWSEGECTKV